VNYSHYTDLAVSLAADLANDLDLSWSPAEVADFVAARGVDRPGRVTRADVAQLLDLQGRLRKVFERGAAGDVSGMAAGLNRLIAEGDVRPELTDHDGSWHLHFRDDDRPPSAIVAAILTAGTALHLVGRGMGRLGRCAADGCGWIYADTSRGGKQRYCSPACANRDAVRRHRARAAVAS